MISERAKHSLNAMVMQGMRSALIGPADTVLSLEPMADIAPVTEQEVVMLSVASYQFRLMILIYFSRDEATRNHYAALTRVQPENMDAQMFHDAIAESGNMCCGTFNRELGRAFEHIGMSTPNMMDSRCAEHFSLLHYGHLQHFALHLQSGMRFRTSLCVTEYQDLDFELAPAEVPESTGELEFF
jgi:CheY-specific phosphatase CheX